MGENENPALSPPARQRIPLPAGYRQAVVSATTFLLGFSLLFVRFWNFELAGSWTDSAVIASILLAVSLVLQVVAVWRSLQVADDDETVYAITLRWFLAAIIALLLSLAMASVSYDLLPKLHPS